MIFTLALVYPRFIRTTRAKLTEQFLASLATLASGLGYKLRALPIVTRTDVVFRVTHNDIVCIEAVADVADGFTVELSFTNDGDDDDDDCELAIAAPPPATSSKFVFEPECLVCMERLATMRGIACVHVCLCPECANKMIDQHRGLVCPLCRIVSRTSVSCIH